MIGKIILSVICFLLFVYIFIFKLIKKNDTTYLIVLVLQAVGILFNFVQILFGVINGIGFNIAIYLFCIIIPIIVFAMEEKGINFSELIYIGLAHVFLLFNNKKKAKDVLIILTSKYDKTYKGHKLLAEIYEQEGGMRKAIDEYIKVLDIKGNDYKSYFTISKLLRDLDRKDEAIEMLQILIKKKPEFSEANTMLRRIATRKEKIQRSSIKLYASIKI